MRDVESMALQVADTVEIRSGAEPEEKQMMITNQKTQSFKIGDRATYISNLGRRHPCIIVGQGEKDGRLVYDCELLDTSGIERDRWGYADQFRR